MRAMQERPPSPELARLLAEYAGRGGVLDFVLFDCHAPRPPEPELHRQAALATLNVLAERSEQYFQQEAVIQAFINGGLDHEKRFRVVTTSDKAQGQQISVAEFVGPGYDVSSRRLLLRGRTPDYLNDFFYADEEETPQTAHDPWEAAREGYAYAFTEPPYPVRGTRAEITALFLSLNAALFNNFGDALTIYQWSTDWSTYFDAGHEWWGTFLWTVHNPQQGLIVGIAGSATD